MGMFDFLLGVGTIIFVSIIWISFTHVSDMNADILSNMTYNSTLDPVDYEEQFTIGNNAMYFSMVYLILLILVWIVKKEQQVQERSYGQ